MRGFRLSAAIVSLALLLIATPTRADESSAAAPTSDDVLDTAKQALEWAQQARATMQSLREAGVSVSLREEEQAVVRVLQRVFESARARAALVVQTPSENEETRARAARRAERRAKLEAAIREGEREVERQQARARAAPRARREAVERDASAAANRLALDRMRLELLKSLEQADVSLATGEPDLLQQIQALQETVPELAGAGAQAPAKAANAPAASAPSSSFGTWASVHRLLALQRARTMLAQLAVTTEKRAREADIDVQQTRTAVRELGRTLRAAAGAGPAAETGTGATSGRTGAATSGPSARGAAGGATAAAEGAASPGTPIAISDFRRELERLKLLGSTLVPLRAEAALLRRFESDMRLWQREIDRDFRSELQNLALGLVGVVLALGAILVGGIVWRIAVNRYVTDPYRRRLALNLRRIVLSLAFVLVLVFHFTSELTALVTALGFAAAGIAFALQNVILEVAGYFSMVAPNGIRVGDRVSLQGPFGYVHGDVIEIGLVRIRLRELTAEGLEPTGRIVVFPNSVVFTGSFFKHPPAQTKAA